MVNDVALTLLFASSANGAVIFSDDFEGETLGAIPSQWVNGPWPNAGTNRVVDTVAAGGSQSLQATSLQGSQKGIYAPGAIHSGNQQVSFDVYLPSGGVANHAFGMLDYLGFDVTFFSNGSGSVFLRSSHGGNFVTSTNSFAAQEWHHIDLDINWLASSFSVKVDNTLFLDSSSMGLISFNTTGGWGSDLSVRGDNQSGPRTVFFDNMSIVSDENTVPAPNTLWLAGLGMLALTGMNRRRKS